MWLQRTKNLQQMSMAVNATSMRRQCNSKLDTMLPASGVGKRGWKGIRPPVQQKLQWLNDYANGRPCLKQTICHSANGVESSSLAELSCVFLGELVVGHRVLLPITGADEGGRGVPEMQNRKHFTPKCGRGRSFSLGPERQQRERTLQEQYI